MEDAAVEGRRAYGARAWADAYDALTRADAESRLEVEDVERLAWSAVLCGREEASVAALERLHDARLEAGDPRAAARAAVWIALRLYPLGERARASGWLARARRLVEGEDAVEQGYLRVPEVFRLTATGDHAGARAAAASIAALGDRHGDADLGALGRNLEGRALVRQGALTDGLPLLDEAMLAATSGRLSPVVTGLVYCSVIAGCQQSHAVDRAREWTLALEAWCEAQPQLVPFTGACRVHRSEILQLGGAWPAAIAEARRAAERLAPTKDFEAGHAFYQEGELQRLRGERAEAERSYALAAERGRDPQPGLALLRLAEGRADLAAAATRRVLAASPEPLARTRVLPAHVEILIAASELDEARRAADELALLAARFAMEPLTATALHAEAAVALAEGAAARAVEPVRRARAIWQRIGAPYLEARSRVLVARAFLALGDEDGARLELEGARRTFTQLGAAPDLAAIDALAPLPSPAAPSPTAPSGAHGLSPRELEVLLLVASGETNRAIARRLFVSERTIDRHVSNIFAKLDVATRAAATAWAYRNGLAG